MHGRTTRRVECQATWPAQPKSAVPRALEPSACPSLVTRARTWRARPELDRLLAAGADARSTPELRVRAEQLTRPATLERITSSLAAALALSELGAPAVPPTMRLRRLAIRDARPALEGLLFRFQDGKEIGVRGAAVASLLVARDGPFFEPANTSLWAHARRASAEIDDARYLAGRARECAGG